MRRKKQPPTRLPISIEVAGKKYTGSYYVEKGMVTLLSPWGARPKPTQVGNSPPEVLARMMLREEFNAAKRRGDL